MAKRTFTAAAAGHNMVFVPAGSLVYNGWPCRRWEARRSVRDIDAGADPKLTFTACTFLTDRSATRARIVEDCIKTMRDADAVSDCIEAMSRSDDY